MNGSSDIPKWFGVAVRMGTLLVIGTLAWANLNAQVDAIDKAADANTVNLMKVEGENDIVDKDQTEQISEIKMNQAVVTNILKNLDKNQARIVKTLEEIQKDLKLHRTVDPN